MDLTKIEKLRAKGAVVDLDSGRVGIRVFLQYQPRILVASRSTRKRRLREFFAKIVPLVEAAGGKVDLDSISISGQVIEATLPLDSYESIAEELKGKKVRTDILIERQVVPS